MKRYSILLETISALFIIKSIRRSNGPSEGATAAFPLSRCCIPKKIRLPRMRGEREREWSGSTLPHPSFVRSLGLGVGDRRTPVQMNEHSRVTVGRPAKHKSCRRGCYTHKLTPSRTHARTRTHARSHATRTHLLLCSLPKTKDGRD